MEKKKNRVVNGAFFIIIIFFAVLAGTIGEKAGKNLLPSYKKTSFNLETEVIKKEIKEINPNINVDIMDEAISKVSIDRMVKKISKSSSKEQMLKVLAEELNGNTPMQVDDVTSIESISANGISLIYDYVMSIEVDNSLIGDWENQIKKQICNYGYDKMWNTIPNQIYVYRYTDINKKKITEFSLTKNKCKEINSAK